MDRNAYRDDTGTDQLRTHPDQLRTHPDSGDTHPSDRDPYPGDRDTYPDQPDTYWRRRAATLAAGLGLLGLLAWAFSGGGGHPAPPASHTSAPAGSAATYPSGPASLAASPGTSPSAGSRSYNAGQDPDFGVDVVSTAPGSCTFDLGPAQLHLVVMSAGRVIWDSADCARGDGTQLSKLTRGVYSFRLSP